MTAPRRRQSHRDRHHDGLRPGLFWNAATSPADPAAEVRDNPRRRPCPPAAGGCGARPAEPCTRIGRGGRVSMTGYHAARQQSATTTERPDQ